MKLKSALAGIALFAGLSSAPAEASFIYRFEQSFGTFEIVVDEIIPANNSTDYISGGVAGEVQTGDFTYVFDDYVTFLDGNQYRQRIQIQPLPTAAGTYVQLFNSFVGLDGQIAYRNVAGTITIAEYVAPVEPTPVPEPLSIALFGTGLVGLGLVRRRSRLSAR